MRSILLLFILLLNSVVFAQKETSGVIDARGINKLVLSSDEIFRIHITTKPGEFISVKSKSDGEYFNDISLDSEVRQGTLYLNSRYRKSFQGGFDKLSAHKVFAMEVELEIPPDMKVEILSNLASVYMEGVYEEVLVQLKSGSCYMSDFSGNAVVNTYDGNIEVFTSNAIIEAKSRHGKLLLPHEMTGIHRIFLNSINGNIKVQETK